VVEDAGPILRELDADGLNVLEPGDLVAAVAAVAPDRPLAEIELALLDETAPVQLAARRRSAIQRLRSRRRSSSA